MPYWWAVSSVHFIHPFIKKTLMLKCGFSSVLEVLSVFLFVEVLQTPLEKAIYLIWLFLLILSPYVPFWPSNHRTVCPFKDSFFTISYRIFRFIVYRKYNYNSNFNFSKLYKFHFGVRVFFTFRHPCNELRVAVVCKI